MMRNDPIDDKLSLFRQQAVIIAGKKETAAEALKEAKDELQQCQQELQEKREAAKNVGSEQILKGDDVRFSALLRLKVLDENRVVEILERNLIY